MTTLGLDIWQNDSMNVLFHEVSAISSASVVTKCFFLLQNASETRQEEEEEDSSQDLFRFSATASAGVRRRL